MSKLADFPRQKKVYLSKALKQSGDSKKRSFQGSTIIRSHLYMWAVSMVATSKNGLRINSDIGKILADSYLSYRQQSKPIKGKDSLIRILFKATRMLFKELCKELT